jgi:hypothetical protein
VGIGFWLDWKDHKKQQDNERKYNYLKTNKIMLITGTTKDGFDAKEVQGMYISENGNEWSNKPYPIHRELYRHLKYVNLSFKEAYEAMLNGTSKASKRVQKYVLANYKAMNPQNK